MTKQDARITRRATLGIGASLIAGYGLRAQPALAQAGRTEGENPVTFVRQFPFHHRIDRENVHQLTTRLREMSLQIPIGQIAPHRFVHAAIQVLAQKDVETNEGSGDFELCGGRCRHDRPF